jgi:hypothetical protein
MERSPMLMEWQKQHNKNGYTTKSNLHVHTVPIKIFMTFITEIKKSTPKFIWKHNRLRIAKTILNKNNNTGSISIANFKLYYRAIAIKLQTIP